MLAAFSLVDASHRVPWYGPTMSAGAALTARVMETWAHGQDIADALGAAHPPSAALRQVAHIGVRALPNSFRTRGLDPPDAEVFVSLRAPDGDEWVWGDRALPDRVVGDARDFCLVVTQRRHLADTSLHGRGPRRHDVDADRPGVRRRRGRGPCARSVHPSVVRVSSSSRLSSGSRK